MTAFKKWGEMILPKEKKKERKSGATMWGWFHYPVWGSKGSCISWPSFGGINNTDQSRKDSQGAIFFYTFPPRNLPRESSRLPSASTPLFHSSDGTENLKIWEGLRGRNWEALLSLRHTILTWNSPRCSLYTPPHFLSLELP